MIRLPCSPLTPEARARPPHPAKVAQPRAAPPAPPACPPHPAKVAQLRAAAPPPPARPPHPAIAGARPTAARDAIHPSLRPPPGAHAGIAQRVAKINAHAQEKHVICGDFYLSETKVVSSDTPPVIIELMETSAASARAKILKLVAAKVHHRFPIAFIFGLNGRIGTQHDDVTKYDKKAVTEALETLGKECAALAQLLEQNGLYGGAFPMTWAPTSTKVGGYTFPFLECRSMLTLHPGAGVVQKALAGLGFMPVVRSMDSDVTNDPLIPESPFSFNVTQERALLEEISAIGEGKYEVASGGYEWDFEDVTPSLLIRLGVIKESGAEESGALIMFLRQLIALMNIYELEAREELAKELGIKAVYLPEPNVYMSLNVRIAGAKEAIVFARKLGSGDAQQRESTYYVKQEGVKAGAFRGVLATRKPLKTYFDEFIKFFAAVFAKPAPAPDIKAVALRIADIRQSHLDPRKMPDILKWHDYSSNELVRQAQLISHKHLGKCAKDFLTLVKELG